MWSVKLILGELSLPSLEEMTKDWKSWKAREQECKDCHDQIDFQTAYILDVVKDLGEDYPYNLDVADLFHEWEHHKDMDITSYRDRSFASKFSGGAT